MDPLVDESIEMAKKLKRLGNSVELSVLPGLPHGFLNFLHVKKLNSIVKSTMFILKFNNLFLHFFFFLVKVSEDANKGNGLCIKHLADLFDKLRDT